MKIRPKTFKLLKELLLEKGGVFYLNNEVLNFEYNKYTGMFINDDYDITPIDVRIWLKYDDWYIKV